jgi:hypothetical protein
MFRHGTETRVTLHLFLIYLTIVLLKKIDIALEDGMEIAKDSEGRECGLLNILFRCYRREIEVKHQMSKDI